MGFEELMQAYFRGEKLEAMLFIVPIGVVLLVFAAVAIKVEKPAFACGVAVPCILFGLAERRARPYTAALEALAVERGVAEPPR